MTAISAGLSTAAMILAASTIFSLRMNRQHTKSQAIIGYFSRTSIIISRYEGNTNQVFPMLSTWIPSGRVFHKYGSI